MKVNHKLLSVVFGGFLLVSIGYIVFSTNKSKTIIKEKEVQYVQVVTSKGELEKEHQTTLSKLNEAESKIDNLSNLNVSANKELGSLKKRIKSILYKTKITKEELVKAQDLISQLNVKIEDHIKENVVLKENNAKLTNDNSVLQTEKTELTTALATTKTEKELAEEKVNLGSTLSISNFSTIGLNSKGKETSVAEKVDNLKLSFTINENRISKSGLKTVYFVVVNPQGKELEVEGQSGVVLTKDGDKIYTAKSNVDYTTGSVKLVSFNIDLNNMVDGLYQIHVYENGIKIGEKKVLLKKKKFLGII
jgi:hypothetical protein